MRKVIIDTNMLLVPAQFKVDIFTELDRVMDEPYELVILDGTMRELEQLAISPKTSGEDKQASKLALLLIDHQRKRDFSASSTSPCKGLKILSSSAKQHVDDAIVEIAEDELVATNDSGLKRRLLEKGIRVIDLRQKKYLAISA